MITRLLSSLRRRAVPSSGRRGFSLVEMMACVSIIGIIAFLAIPSITRMRSESEINLAITRAEALNMAQASFIQVRGRTDAAIKWNAASGNEARYQLLREFMSYAEPTLIQYLPYGYQVKFNTSITTTTKVELTSPAGAKIDY